MLEINHQIINVHSEIYTIYILYAFDSETLWCNLTYNTQHMVDNCLVCLVCGASAFVYAHALWECKIAWLSYANETECNKRIQRLVYSENVHVLMYIRLFFFFFWEIGK